LNLNAAEMAALTAAPCTHPRGKNETSNAAHPLSEESNTARGTIMEIICKAIERRSLLEFDYNGLHRVVEPYLLGETTANNAALRAVQVRGESSNPRGSEEKFGKLWTLASMSNVRMLNETFEPDDPDYNPDDKGMKSIRCRV
jgi:hypothetical protein